MDQEYHETVSGTVTRTGKRPIEEEDRISRERLAPKPFPYAYKVTPAISRLLRGIREHCGPGGTIKPGVRTLAQWADCASAGRITNMLRQLAADGWILYDGPSGCITLCIDPDEPIEPPPTPDVGDEADPLGIAGNIYLLRCGDAYKIGCSTDVKRRIAEFSLPYKELVHVVKSANMYRDEAALHAHFHDKQINNEWFRLDAADVAWFKDLDESGLITSADQRGDRDQPADRDHASDRSTADSAPITARDRVPGHRSPLLQAITRRDRSPQRMEDHDLEQQQSHESTLLLLEHDLPCADDSITPRDRLQDTPAGQVMAELGAERAVIVDALETRPDWTVQQVRDRWAYDQARIEASAGRLTEGVFFHALRRGQLAPERPAAVDWSAYTTASPPEEAESLHAHARRILPDASSGHDFQFVLARLGMGDSDDEALAALRARGRRPQRGAP